MTLALADVKSLSALLDNLGVALELDDGGLQAAALAAQMAPQVLVLMSYADDGAERAALGTALRACSAAIDRVGLLMMQGR